MQWSIMNSMWGLLLPCILNLLCSPLIECVGIFRVAQEPGIQQGSFFYHIEDGYFYHESFRRGDSVYFKCIRYPRCGGRAIFDPVDGFEHTMPHRDDHVCRVDLFYPAECELKRKILQRCRELDVVSCQRIIDEESQGYDIEVRSRITEARMRTSMRNARMANYPNLPHTLRALSRILFNPAYRLITMTRDGEDNLYAGSVTDELNAHHVVFASQRMIGVMREFRILQCDGTFKVRPAGLETEQVFCVVGVRNNRVIPLMWALMESRTVEAYVAVLRLLQNQLGDNIELRRFIMDFEPAEIRGVEEVFHCRVQGCFWHAIRWFLTYVTDRGLLRPMRQLDAVRRIIRLTMALPLLPQFLMRQGLVIIIQEARDEGHFIYAMVRPYLQDLYRLWFRSDRKIRQLCVFGSAQRTNNACECHNRCLRDELGVHPNVYAFINGLIRIEQRAWDDIYRLGNNRRAGRSRAARSIMNDANINNLGQNLINNPGNLNRRISEFLQGACHLMDGVVREAMV